MNLFFEMNRIQTKFPKRHFNLKILKFKIYREFVTHLQSICCKHTVNSEMLYTWNNDFLKNHIKKTSCRNKYSLNKIYLKVNGENSQ